MASLIVFDIGGVLIDFSEDYYVKHILGEKKSPRIGFVKRFNQMIKKLETGMITTGEMETWIASYLALPKSKVGWRSGFTTLSKPDKRVISLVNKLHRKYKVVLLSNISRSRYLAFRKLYASRLNVDGIFASAYIGLRKPDTRIYRYVLNVMKADARNTLFVDNCIENVEGAKKAGLKAIHYVGYGDLLKRLNALGVDTR